MEGPRDQGNLLGAETSATGMSSGTAMAGAPVSYGPMTPDV